MPELTLWKNREIDKLRKEVDLFFNRFWSDFGTSLFAGDVARVLKLEFTETDDTLIYRARLSGIGPQDIEISVTEDAFVIRGEARTETCDVSPFGGTVGMRCNTFSRTVRLPCKINAEGVQADYEKGVLTLVMPKKKDVKARTVKIMVKNG